MYINANSLPIIMFLMNGEKDYQEILENCDLSVLALSAVLANLVRGAVLQEIVDQETQSMIYCVTDFGKYHLGAYHAEQKKLEDAQLRSVRYVVEAVFNTSHGLEFVAIMNTLHMEFERATNLVNIAEEHGFMSRYQNPNSQNRWFWSVTDKGEDFLKGIM